MEAQSVVARNDGYRGWRHEGAVTMAPKEEKKSTSVVAGGGGHRRRLHEGPVSQGGSIPPSAYTTHLGSNRMPYRHRSWTIAANHRRLGVMSHTVVSLLSLTTTATAMMSMAE